MHVVAIGERDLVTASFDGRLRWLLTFFERIRTKGRGPFSTIDSCCRLPDARTDVTQCAEKKMVFAVRHVVEQGAYFRRQQIAGRHAA